MYELIELFNTIQGEGSTQGLPVTLIRYPACNLLTIDKKPCSFCDTIRTMQQEPKSYTLENIYRLSNISRNLLITGGEPTMYNLSIIFLLTELYRNHNALLPKKVIVETNGYNLIDLIDRLHRNDPLLKIYKYVFSWSPKIWSDELFDRETKLLQQLSYFPDVEIKLVINPKDYEREESFIDLALGVGGFDKTRIWLMPLGGTYNELMVNLYPVIQLCHEWGVNLSPRLHIVFGKDLDKELNTKK